MGLSMSIDKTGIDFNNRAHLDEIIDNLAKKNDFGKNHLGDEELSRAHIAVVHFCRPEVREAFTNTARFLLEQGDKHRISNFGISTSLLISSGDTAAFQTMRKRDPEIFADYIAGFYKTLTDYCQLKGVPVHSTYHQAYEAHHSKDVKRDF